MSQDWNKYQFEYLLPKWTKELLDEEKLTSENFFELRSSKHRFTRDKSSNYGEITLADLGRDVLKFICSHLTFHDLVSLCKVSKLWNVR